MQRIEGPNSIGCFAKGETEQCSEVGSIGSGGSGGSGS